jgi:dTDP-glucose 4,6-dehydratase
MLIDLFCVELAILLGIGLRYDTIFDIWTFLRPCWPLLVAIPLIRLPVYLRFRLSRRVWRYASIHELTVIALAGAVGPVAIFFTNFVLFPVLGVPHCPSPSVLFLEALLSSLFLAATRLFLRQLQERLPLDEIEGTRLFVPNRRRVLIVGAGDAGSMTLRQILGTPDLGWKAIGFVDDDTSKRELIIQGVAVLGTREDLAGLVKKHFIDEVIVAMPSASPSAIDDIFHICATAGVPTRVLPSPLDLLTGTLTVDQIRQLRPTDYHPHQPAGDLEEASPLQNVLVTGGAGFIGANFVHYMLEKYPTYRIVVFDKLTYAGNLDNLIGLEEAFDHRYAFVRGDICDYGAVSDAIQTHEIDAIVNFAAESHVDRSLMDPESFLHTNIFGTHSLLRAARHFQVRRFHQVSTDEVYGQVFRGSFGEEDPLETRSPYSASKAAADLLVHAFFASFDVKATITRGSNNIGPYQYPEKVVPLFITNALNDKPLPLYGDGCYVRDYQYVLDHCRGIDLVLHRGVPGEIYNLGSGNEVQAIDLARMILDKLGRPHSLLRLVADRPGQDRRYSLNCAKICALGWTPQWDYERALEETIAWYLENEWWWKKIKNAKYWQYYERQYSERLARSVPVEGEPDSSELPGVGPDVEGVETVDLRTDPVHSEPVTPDSPLPGAQVQTRPEGLGD